MFACIDVKTESVRLGLHANHKIYYCHKLLCGPQVPPLERPDYTRFSTCILWFYFPEASYFKSCMKGFSHQLRCSQSFPAQLQMGVVLPEIPQCVAAAKIYTPEDYIKILTWGMGVEMGLCCKSCFALLIQALRNLHLCQDTVSMISCTFKL